LDSTGSGHGPVAGCGECGGEPSSSCATELVSYIHKQRKGNQNTSKDSDLCIIL
jgi:hypothetical protein